MQDLRCILNLTMNPNNQESNRNPDGTFIPGVSGNPAGRPKGKTMKEFARDWYMNMTDEEKVAYIKTVEDKRPGFAWEMGEGKASQATDITSKGEKIVVLPTEIYAKHDTPSQPSADSE